MQISSAKLKIPSPRRCYILRKKLFDKLHQGISMSIVYICSGAGTGKTTLLSSFIRETNQKNIGWFTLDASTANVYSFWLYAVSALNPILQDDRLLSFIKSNPAISKIEQLLETLADLISGKGDCYLVIDDLQYMTDTALIRTFEYFLKIMPENLHLFMLSREKSPVYLGQFAISGKLLFIGADEMQLSDKEGMSFLQMTLGIQEPEENLKQIVSYAEGWIGGLQLVAAAEHIQEKHSITDFTSQSLSSVGNDSLSKAGGGIAADYLNREIFESLTHDEQDFLVCTGLLSYFDADICSHYIEGYTSNRFRMMIDSLSAKNLFIICIDDVKGVYRYHNILSDFLTRQFMFLPDDRQKQLLNAAAAAFEQQRDISESLRLLLLAENYDGAMHLAALQPQDNTETWYFLNKIPDQQIIKNPDLAFQCLIYNIGTLNINHCKILYDLFMEQYSGDVLKTVIQFSQAYTLKDTSILPDYPAFTTDQIESLPLGDSAKAMIYLENASVLMDRLEYTEAERCINRALENDAGGNTAVMTFGWGQKAQLYEELGKLNESLNCYRTSLQFYDASSIFSGIGTNFYIGVTGVYMRRMELDKAQAMLDHSHTIYNKQHRVITVIDMTIMYHDAEIEILRGNVEKGRTLVYDIIKKYTPINVLNLGRLLMELDCEKMLKPTLAQQFLQQFEVSPENYRSMPFMRLLEVRILAEKGEKENSFEKIENMITLFRSRHNKLRLIEADLLKLFLSTIYPEAGISDREKKNLIRETVYYAWEDRILMPYYLERTTVLPLLRNLLSEKPERNELSAAEIQFVNDAVSVCTGNQIVSSDRSDKTLSGREMEVLNELSEGITNQEIADRMYISLATVKTHIQNIYSKLGVSSRMKAVEEAKNRGII